MGRSTQITARLRERIPEGRFEAYPDVGTDVLVVEPGRLVEVLTELRDGFGFDLLCDVSAVDWLPREPRYDVNYHLAVLETNERLRVKVQLPDVEAPTVPSATAVYPGAEWHEREVYDFFGVVFTGHPDLKRILMPDEWIGHPLRKDYAVGGVPVEYKIEPAYIGDSVVSEESRASAGGVPARFHRDRGKPSHWTWTGPPATGVHIPERPEPPQDAEEPGDQDTGGSS